MNDKVTLKLFGGHTFNNAKIESVSASVLLSAVKDKYDLEKLENSLWDENTLLNANFNGTTDGSNFEGSFEDIKYYKIFKTIGDSKYPHFVAQTENPHDTICKDYVVGSYCPYKYYIYPVCSKTIEEQDCEVIHSPIVVDYSCELSCIKLIGLIQDSENPNEFYIDKNNIWNMYANVDDNGISLNNDKTFTDSENMMSQEMFGPKNYITKDITGMIAKIDCENKSEMDFIDSYDDLIHFKDFITSANMKLLVDVRGVILVGEVEANPKIDYAKSAGHPATATFTFRQLEDLKNVKIHGEVYTPEVEGETS